MERDVNHPLPVTYPAGAHFFTGRVAYTHGLGLDAPLGVIRVDHSTLFDTPFVVTPYTTWTGTYDSGSGVPCDNVWEYGPGPGDSTLVEVCVTIDWPAPYLWVSQLSRQRSAGPRTWLGGLIEGQRDLTGQLYRRNRYYDPASGRFTQEDPIGLAGGLNLYGFAAGDPVNFSDPFGLLADTYVNCRPARGEGSEGTFAHCAVRVTNAELNVDHTFEMAPTSEAGGTVTVNVSGPDDPAVAKYTGPWVQVAPPEGMSSTEFDQRVLRSVTESAREIEGLPYMPDGTTNSNRFVYEVIRQAGGKVPAAASAAFKFAPGICGGSGLARGRNCSP